MCRMLMASDPWEMPVNDLSPQGTGHPASTGADHDVAGQPGVIGIALAAVLAAALAQGSWQWFATYIGATLLAVVFAFYRLPAWTPGIGSAYARNLVAYSLVVGLCVAIALAPVLQRWTWLFPMPGTRSECPELGRYEAIRAGPGWRTWPVETARLWFTRRRSTPMTPLPSAWRPPRPGGCPCTEPGRRCW